ncbi:MAG: hypothetical protein ACKVT1_01300 [Dehalococcoidia bacterium]
MDEETKEQIRAWKRGHEMVNAVVREENRRKTPEERLWELCLLYAMGEELGANQRPNEQRRDRDEILRRLYERRHVFARP